jgi:hypothetical protein
MEVAMWRLVRVLLAALLALVVTAPPAAAEPRERQLAGMLGDLWETVIETPAAAFQGCVQLDDRTVAPFTGPGVPIDCTVSAGTQVFVVLWSSECSTAEVGTIWEAKNAGQARQCARQVDAGATELRATLRMLRPGSPSAAVPLATSEVETHVLRLDVPTGNILGPDVPAQDAVSVAHGWVALTEPLARGTYEIVIEGAGTYPLPGVFPFRTVTTITVT